MKGAISTTIVLETRTPLKDGRCPVKLRITYQRQSRYYSLKDLEGVKIALSKKDFEKLNGNPRSELKEKKTQLNAIEKIARDIIKKEKVFSFDVFEQRFYGGTGNDQDLIYSIKKLVEQLKSEERISTALSYECAIISLVKYKNKSTLPEKAYNKEYTDLLKGLIGKTVLPFENVDIPFLNNYEKWMKENDNSPTTIGIYLRYVRAAFNEAIRKGAIESNMYPFGKGKYEIPTGRNVKKAITQKEIGLIASYSGIDGTNEQRFRDYWLFCYMSNGMNVKDMAYLQYKNIDNEEGVIIFQREKTKRKNKKQPRNIRVVITKTIGRIIDRWGNKPVFPEQYVFPILSEGFTPLQQLQKSNQTIKMINKYINRIAEQVGIKQKVTSYTARHSFATVLKRTGASTEFISESLGHSNLNTTENYLADFEIKEKRKWAEIVEQATKGEK